MSGIRGFLTFLAFLALAGAARAEPAYDGPALTLAVEEIAIRNDYVPPLRDPHIGHLSPFSPAAAAEAWAAERLHAGGAGAARAEVIIREAPLTEEPLEQETGFKSLFTTQQSERYAGRIAAEIRFLDADGARLGSLNVEVERSSTIAEDATLSDREALWVEIAERLATDLDAQVRRIMARDLPSLLR